MQCRIVLFSFLKMKEMDKEKNKTFELKSTVVINVVVLPSEIECLCKFV